MNSLYVGGANQIEDEDERDRAKEPLEARQNPLLERICELRATSPAGHEARARTLATWAPDIGKGEWIERRLLSALLRDMTGA